MKRRRLMGCVILATILSTGTANACLWDYDTLAMERRRFPSALELITGKFLRHGYDYYRWRIEDRKKRIKAAPKNLAFYDDLAVAYDKIGEHDKAIETILKKEELMPGQYETYANLGTFYIHSGRFKEGLKYIEKAIKINPDAHFGREVYQKLLVEYVLLASNGGKIELPLSEQLRKRHQPSKSDLPRSFADYVINTRKMKDKRDEEIERAVKGILGMMRFGKHDSPILLEALGDLLIDSKGLESAKRLAARAYLKASYAVNDPQVRSAYRKKAERAIKLQTKHRKSGAPLDLEQLEKRFQGELKEADEWYADVKHDEARWIDAGENVDEKFSETYYEEPEVSADYSDGFPGWGGPPDWSTIAIAFFTILFFVGVGIWSIRKVMRAT